MNSAAGAFIVACVTALASGSAAIRLLSRFGVRQVINSDAPERHQAKRDTPTMGGVIIILGVLIGIAAFWSGDPRVAPVVVLTLALAALGFVDDYLIASRGKSLGLKARHKLVAQFLIAIAFVVWVVINRTAHPNVIYFRGNAGIYVGWGYYPIAVLLVAGMSNAVNLTDGLDGLAAGLTAIAAVTLGLVVLGAPGKGSGLAIASWAIAGACIGFLWYNCHPARVFMGDTGSLALGGAVAGIAIAGRYEMLLIPVAALFIVEMLSVMIQVVSFKTTGKRVFKMTPLHHHFELAGWPETRIVARFWIVQLVICVGVLTSIGVFGLWN